MESPVVLKNVKFGQNGAANGMHHQFNPLSRGRIHFQVTPVVWATNKFV